MSYFDSEKEMLAEAETLIHESIHESEDEATLSDFYNGHTLNEKDAGDIGALKNHLMGYDNMNDARLSLEGVFTRQQIPFHVKLINANPQVRKKWEMAVENIFNRIVKKSGRFKPAWKGLCGTITLMGRGCLVFTDRYDWCPRLMNPLVPRRTGTQADDVSYAVIPGEYTLKELKGYHNSAAANPDTAWKPTALKACIDMLEKNVGTSMSDGAYGPSDKITQVEQREVAKEGWGASLRTAILVFHVYENCQEENGTEYVRHSIIARHREDIIKTYREKTGTNMPVLFYQDDTFADRPAEWLTPFFIDCQIGRPTTWHNSMGLGRMNYDTDVEAEAFLNEANAGAMENLRRVYSVSEGTDIETAQQFLSGNEGSNILPAGLLMVEQGKNANFPIAIQMMQMSRQISAGHARSSVPNSAEGSSKELEIQAMERQGRNAAALSSRMSDFFDNTAAAGEEMLRRMIVTEPLPQDAAYHEIIEFQDALKKAGVPIARLREKGKDGKLKNVLVEVNRAIGTGDRVQEVMANREMMANIDRLSPQSQQMLLRHQFALINGDYNFAEELIPDRPKKDPNQIERANTENQICINRGIAGYVPPLNDDDMPQYHIEEHMGGLEAMLAKGDAQGWDQMDIAAFKSLGAHTMLHVQQFDGRAETKNFARQLTGRLQEMAGKAGEFIKAAEQKQAEQQLSLSEQIRFQQSQEKLDLSKTKEHNVVQNRQATLDLKAAELASKDVSAGKKAQQQDRMLANAEFATDADVALRQYETDSRPEPKPAAPK